MPEPADPLRSGDRVSTGADDRSNASPSPALVSDKRVR